MQAAPASLGISVVCSEYPTRESATGGEGQRGEKREKGEPGGGEEEDGRNGDERRARGTVCLLRPNGIAHGTATRK